MPTGIRKGMNKSPMNRKVKEKRPPPNPIVQLFGLAEMVQT